MRVLPCGDAALLLEVDRLDEVLALTAALEAAALPGVTDLIPSARTVLIRCEPQRADLNGLRAAISTLRPGEHDRPDVRLVEIPVRYDGTDLEEVGEWTGLGARGVVEAHTGQEWTVAFNGFAPGFGYLVGEHERLKVPRRANPRTTVPAGSVALAAEFSAVYPRASPGGWRLIGRTLTEVWDLTRDVPALLTTGCRVRFREVS